MTVRTMADALIEAPIITSFTRPGYEARKRLASWSSLDDYALTGQVVVLTGATSGLGTPQLNNLRAAERRWSSSAATLIATSVSSPS